MMAYSFFGYCTGGYSKGEHTPGVAIKFTLVVGHIPVFFVVSNVGERL